MRRWIVYTWLDAKNMQDIHYYWFEVLVCLCHYEYFLIHFSTKTFFDHVSIYKCLGSGWSFCSWWYHCWASHLNELVWWLVALDSANLEKTLVFEMPGLLHLRWTWSSNASSSGHTCLKRIPMWKYEWIWFVFVRQSDRQNIVMWRCISFWGYLMRIYVVILFRVLGTTQWTTTSCSQKPCVQ